MAIMNNRRKDNFKFAVKWILYSLVIIMSTVFVTSGNGKSAVPLLLIPVFVSISMYNNELVSGIIGGICGILLDTVTGKLLGFNAVIMLVLGVASSFLFLHLLKRNILNTIVLTAVIAFLQGLLDLFFNYAMWDIPDYSVVFTGRILPSIVKTILTSPIIYLIIKIITMFLSPKERIEVEERIS